MGLLKVDNVVRWSIPVNGLAESERFYGEVLGLTFRGRLGNSCMSCFTVGAHSIHSNTHFRTRERHCAGARAA